MNYITFTTSGSLQLCKNFIISLKKLNMEESITVYCLDQESLSEISKFKCKTKFFDIDGVREGFHNYGERDFRRVTEAKVQIILNELQDKESLVYTDCDVVFKEDPTGFIEFSNAQTPKFPADTPAPEIIFASDGPFMPICTGFMYIRNTENVHKLFKKYFEMSKLYGKQESKCMYDQEIIYEILTKDQTFMWDTKFTYGIYPTEFVKNGHLYWNEAETRTGKEVVVHVNFTIGEESKINRLKDADLWYIEEEVSSL